jgi:tRNA nucleotidyltransferase (CCA-adding enzyme)
MVITLIEKACELLQMFYSSGYEAYVVGGFVRDIILGRNSFDVDIATNATPKEVQMIFKDVKLPFEGYGSVHLVYKKVNFEITTYRMDLEYQDKRNLLR